MNTNSISGNAGPKIRSDCEMILQLRNGGGIDIDLKSKVQVLYGASIRKLCIEILVFFGIRDALLTVNDSGALDWVIGARLESAVKRLINTELEFLPPFRDENKYQTASDRFRFSRLYIPGNAPAMMINAGLHSSDGIILDLEDSVAPEKKDEARILVRNALRQVNFYGAERMVRINQGERGLKDLEFVIPQNVNLVIIPKCEDPGQVRLVDSKISEIKERSGLTNQVHLMPVIESALGVERSFEIAKSTENVAAMAIGLEDYTADLGVPRTTEGKESFYARTRLIVSAKAAGVQPIDSVFSDVADLDLLRQNVLSAKALGFEGMGCIHPRQVSVIKQGFAPGRDEIDRSVKIVAAYEEAARNGLGVVALGSKMIDAPVVARAQKTIDLAARLGLMSDKPVNESNQEEK